VFRLTIALLLGLSLATTALADQNRLQNSKLKEKDYDRLEGNSPFKVGCRHIIRSESRGTVYHPTVLTNEEIGLNYKGKWMSVAAGDKTRLSGADESVTVWRACKFI
jgi:hypothetical protein